MAWPESEFGRKEIRSAILAAQTPDEFFDKHLSNFRGSWMEKSFWTIKENPEFNWSNGKSYVELPHTKSLGDILTDVKLFKNRAGSRDNSPYGSRIFLHKRQGDEFGGFRGNYYYSAWGRPTELLIDTWRRVWCGNPFDHQFGIGGIEIIPWHKADGCRQKYLIVADPNNHIGSCWLALVTDINIAIEDEENTEKKQA
jgi:hypothetical protein